MPLRVADAVAVLDELGIERAHFIGNSWGGRLGFGIGEHAPERVLSLVIGGQQPYAIDPDGPLAHAATETLAESRRGGSLEPFVDMLESFAGGRLPDALRERWLDNDSEAIEAAWSAALAEGTISEDQKCNLGDAPIFATRHHTYSGKANSLGMARRIKCESGIANAVTAWWPMTTSS
jgi:pimeloyl-ACP methyl ester carboxylesterase